MGRKVLLIGGIFSSLLYVFGIERELCPSEYPDYHKYADQMVSELLAVGAPTRTLMVWLCILVQRPCLRPCGGRLGIR